MNDSTHAPKFNVHDRVYIIGEADSVGMVVSITKRVAGIQYYEVFWGGKRGQTKLPEHDLRFAVEAESPIENMLNGNFSDYHSFLRLIIYNKLSRDHPLRNNIYAFNASRTRFYPHQFKPVMKLIDSTNQRLLICDEVGLGKTIEAGLILTEQQARQHVRRVMVVCPSNLRFKWKDEMKNRFGEDFRIYYKRELMEFFREYEQEGELTKFRGIVSMETIRGKSVQKQIEQVSPMLDLVIIDEAHHMRNTGTLTRKAGKNLGSLASSLVMLTATPVHLGSSNLHSLLNILDPDEFKEEMLTKQTIIENEPIVRAQNALSMIPPNWSDAREKLEEAISTSTWVKNHPYTERCLALLKKLENKPWEAETMMPTLLQAQVQLLEINAFSHIFTRSLKREVQIDIAQRQSFAVTVHFSERELHFYRDVSQLVNAESDLRDDLPIIKKWRLNLPQRRMASSIRAMVEHYRKHEFWGKGDFDEDSLDLETLDDSEFDYSAFTSEERYQIAAARIRRLIDSWPEEEPDSKYETMREQLVRLREQGPLKVIVFAFFKATLNYLLRRLAADGFPSLLIHGGVSHEDRYKIIEEFREGKIEILLCSRVGSEGLDFQFCNSMFNYDMPWNPMELEQRIGRLDRIGQESKRIFIHNLWVEDTIEDRILRRLYERIGIFEGSIGSLEPILGDIVAGVHEIILNPELSEEDKQRESDRELMVFNNREQELNELEKKAAQFIGTDAFFENEIKQVQTNREYVTGIQLRRYVTHFLKSHCPHTRFSYNAREEMGVLKPDNELQSILVKTGQSVNLKSGFYVGRDIPITFDSDVAFKNPTIEFINILHPIVTAVQKAWGENPDAGNTHQILLRTDKLKTGFYLYFVFKLMIHAANSRNLLKCIIVNEQGEIVDEIKSREVFGLMVEKGEDILDPVIGELDKDFVKELYEQVENHFTSQISALTLELRETNDIFLDRRIRALKLYYQRIINTQEQLLEKEEAKGDRADKRIIRLREGVIRNREADLQSKKEEFEKKRHVSVEHKQISTGILFIKGNK